MSIPSNPTLAEIITEGLKRGGRTTPTTAQISDATTHFLREVKSDIKIAAGKESRLKTTYVTKVTAGISRYAWPADADAIDTVTLLDSSASEFWAGTLQGGSTTTATVAAAFAEGDINNVIGRYIFFLSGAGANQEAQIANYDTTTKVVTFDKTLPVAVDATTEYFIATSHITVYRQDKALDWDMNIAPFVRGTPYYGAMQGEELWLGVAPDRTYALWWSYWADLDRIDDTGAVFTSHLREYRSLWIQGIAVKTAQRYDEDRYTTELQVYQNMLNEYGARACNILQVRYSDF